MLNYNNIQQLGQTYNTLTLISTKGEDTIYMAECLKTLKSLYSIFKNEYDEQQSQKEETKTSEEEEIVME